MKILLYILACASLLGVSYGQVFNARSTNGLGYNTAMYENNKDGIHYVITSTAKWSTESLVLTDSLIAGTKGSSLKDIGAGYAIIDNSIYFAGKKINNADPMTFKIVKDGGLIGDGTHRLASDKESMYRKGENINGADPENYIALINGFGKDNKNVYIENKILCGADPESLDKKSWGGYFTDKNFLYSHDGTRKLSLTNDISDKIVYEYIRKDGKTISDITIDGCTYLDGLLVSGDDCSKLTDVDMSCNDVYVQKDESNLYHRFYTYILLPIVNRFDRL